MHCSNCGAEIPEGAEFCPECGHKVGEIVEHEKSKPEINLTPEMKESIKSHVNKKNIFRLVLVLAVLIVGFVGYRLLYLPGVVKSEVAKTEFRTANYSVKANVLTKKIVITTENGEIYNLVAASTENGFLTNPIGAEEQMMKMGKDLPGNWTIQIIQTTRSDAPRVMWQYSDGHESIRYQNSNEYRRAKQAYVEASEKKDATNSEIDSAVSGAVVGGLIGAALGR